MKKKLRKIEHIVAQNPPISSFNMFGLDPLKDLIDLSEFELIELYLNLEKTNLDLWKRNYQLQEKIKNLQEELARTIKMYGDHIQ